MLTTLLFALFAGAGAVLGALSARGKATMCNVSKDTVPVPSTANDPPTPLASAIPAGPRFIALGVGVQNYTCSSTGTFTYVFVPLSPMLVLTISHSSTGAVAELFDISCFRESAFTSITDRVNAAWQAAPSGVTAQDIISTLAPFDPPFVLGQHFFIVNPITGSGLSPKWDFTSASEKGHPNAFVVGARTGDVHAPEDSATNVDWLSLNKAQGDLADQVFRVVTRGGQPPTSVRRSSLQFLKDI